MNTDITKFYADWCSLKGNMKQVDMERLERKFMLEFNYNTNHIEGNTLTYGQTEILLMFGRASEGVKMRDLEEMKAHNVCLQMIREEAQLKDKPLTETFIRNVHLTMIREDYVVHKTDKEGKPYSYTIHAGIYKTRPNSVITVTGEKFEYASPEETAALMSDLVQWYNAEEKKGELNVMELASLFHYRYIRIHPFEDGNGRMARLLVNYILAKQDYPMVVVKSKDKENYLLALNKCDVVVGSIPSDGAHAEIDQITPFVEYMTGCELRALDKCIKAAKGESIEDDDDFQKQMKLLARQASVQPKEDERLDTMENKMDVYNMFHRDFAMKLVEAVKPAEIFFDAIDISYLMSTSYPINRFSSFYDLLDTPILNSDTMDKVHRDIIKNAKAISFNIKLNRIKPQYRMKKISMSMPGDVLFERRYYEFCGERYNYGTYPTPEKITDLINRNKTALLNSLSSAKIDN